MRYGGFWQDQTPLLRVAAFGVVLIVVILAGLGVRHLRHAQPKVETYSALFAAVKQNIQDADATENAWLSNVDDNYPQHVKDYQYTLSTSAQPRLTMTAHSYFSLGNLTNQVTAALEKAGYKKVDAPAHYAATTDAPRTLYRQGEKECILTADSDAARVVLQCSDPAELAQRAAEARPFVESYLGNHMDVRPQDVIFGQLTIKSRDGGLVLDRSRAAGYDLAEAVIYRPGAAKGSLALFYSHDGQWHYVAETDTLDERSYSCSVIEADAEASKAFVGNLCLDDHTGHFRSSGVVN